MAVVASQETTTSSFDGAHQLYGSSFKDQHKKNNDYYHSSSLTTNPTLSKTEYLAANNKGDMIDKDYFSLSLQGTNTTTTINNNNNNSNNNNGISLVGGAGTGGIEDKKRIESSNLTTKNTF
ncbi:unnamed protein product [Cunninghamella blakesleeana]